MEEDGEDLGISRSERASGRGRHPLIFLSLVSGWVLLFTLVISGIWLWYALAPTYDGTVDIEAGFIVDGHLVTEPPPAWDDENNLMIPATFLSDELGFALHEEFDDVTGRGRLIWTAPHHLLEIHTGETVAEFDGAEIDLLIPSRIIDSQTYLPANFVTAATGISFREFRATERVIVEQPGDSFAFGNVVEPTEPRGSYSEALRVLFGRIVSRDARVILRQENHPKAEVLLHLDVGECVDVVDERDGWLRVYARGVEGYVPGNSVSMAGVRTADESVSDGTGGLPNPVDWDSWNPERPLDGERVTLVWEHVRSGNPDVEDIGPMPGLNVISPTWFSLADERGRFTSMADADYVRWAKDRGFLIWGLATNSFDPELTASVLRDADAREEMVQQLIAYATMYRLDGINIDFENVYFEDRELLTQFIRELAPRAHELGLTLSMDVTMISTSRTWSMCYDREALAGVVDYLILMAYDEHWASSPVAGSVGSLPWVERGLRAVLGEVPPDRLILGIPFYTRVWRESSDGTNVKVSSEAVGMNTQRDILAEHGDRVTWDERAAQHYLEYEDGEDTIKIWIEDEASLRARLNLVQRYDLAGVAGWRRGLEIPQFWPIIRDEMSHWP